MSKQEARALDLMVQGVVDVEFAELDDCDEKMFLCYFEIEGERKVLVAKETFVDPAGFYMD